MAAAIGFPRDLVPVGNAGSIDVDVRLALGNRRKRGHARSDPVAADDRLELRAHLGFEVSHLHHDHVLAVALRFRSNDLPENLEFDTTERIGDLDREPRTLLERPPAFESTTLARKFEQLRVALLTTADLYVDRAVHRKAVRAAPVGSPVEDLLQQQAERFVVRRHLDEVVDPPLPQPIPQWEEILAVHAKPDRPIGFRRRLLGCGHLQRLCARGDQQIARLRGRIIRPALPAHTIDAEPRHERLDPREFVFFVQHEDRGCSSHARCFVRFAGALKPAPEPGHSASSPRGSIPTPRRRCAPTSPRSEAARISAPKSPQPPGIAQFQIPRSMMARSRSAGS